MIKTILSCT